MRRFLYLIIFIGCVTTAHAQFQFQKVSLSDALIQLDESSKRYDISFVYDELEDFTVTKTIKKGCPLPDAVREVCGFYPVRVTTKGRDILVECIKKDRTKLIGRLVDTDRQPIAYANIVLYDASDTVVIGGGVSNEAGDFVIPCSMSHAKVRISCVGFKTIERQMPVTDVGTIRMQMDNKLLNSVTVNGQMPIIRNEGNRLQYIVNNDEYAKGFTALELLNRVPMVSMMNGRATILGKGVAHYMMNGRVMEMDDDVIHQRLWSMRAEDIERIEVIAMPTGKYLTDLGGGYINIVMNRDQNLGWRSDMSVQAGTSDKWNGRADASVNYASKKFDAALDVNGNWLTKTEDKEMRHSFAHLDRIIESHKESKDKDLGAHLMLRYLPTKKLELGAYASYQYFWPKSDNVSNGHRYYYSDYEKKDNIFFSESRMKYAGNHVLNLSAYLDWTLGKPDSKLSLSYNFYKKQDDHESNVYGEDKNDTVVVYQQIHFANESSYRIHSARLDLSKPLSTATLLNAGISYTIIKTKVYTNEVNANIPTFMTTSKQSENFRYINCLNDVPSVMVSGIQSDHKENILSGHLSVQHHFSKRLKAIAALRYEHTKSKILEQDNIRNDNFYPTLLLNYQSDHIGQIGVAWAMSVTRPNFYDLNPLMIFDSYYDWSQGSPYLTPSYENHVEMNYSHKGLYANIYYTHGKDQIDWITVLSLQTNSETLISLTTPSNNYKSDKTGIYVNYHHSLSQKVNAVAEGELFYYDAKIYPEIYRNSILFLQWWPDGRPENVTMPASGTPTNVNGWGKRISISSDFFLNRQHSLLLNARYDQWLDDYVGLSKIDAYGYFTFALRYSLLDDRLKLLLTAVDPFHQHIVEKTSYYHYDQFQKDRTNLHSHYIGLTATYSLGGKKVRQIHHDFSDTEQERAEKK